MNNVINKIKSYWYHPEKEPTTNINTKKKLMTNIGRKKESLILDNDDNGIDYINITGKSKYIKREDGWIFPCISCNSQISRSYIYAHHNGIHYRIYVCYGCDNEFKKIYNIKNISEIIDKYYS